MRQLIYLSTATSGFREPELGPILYHSRLNNRDVNVTGLLLFDGRRFLQALEGDEAEVMRTYRRIGGDKRHRKVVPLFEREVAVREFGNWHMATRALEATGYSSSVEALVAGVTCPEVRAAFTDFTLGRRKAA